MMQRIYYSIFLLFFSLPCVSNSLISSIKIQNSYDHALINVDSSTKTITKIFLLHNPERLVLDLYNSNTRVNTGGLHYNLGLIKNVRTGYPTANVLRLVFDLQSNVFLNYTLGNALDNKIKIQLKSKNSKLQNIAQLKPQPSNLYVKHVSYSGNRDIIVVLDPGHGGKDPGATGPKHTQEKRVVLAIARQLKQIIDHQPGMHAVLTREGDYYVGLRQRLNIARKYNADVFIAIHADAVTNHDSYGATVYALSQRGATSEAARWLAAKENHSELGGVKLSRLHDQSGIIRTVLIDLSQTATIGASLQIGANVLDHLNIITSLHHRRVEQARFVVLKSPDIPSILIETGFISNPVEENNLVNPNYQRKLTQAIFNGIKHYFWNHPPHGTKIEAMLNRK